MAAELHIVGEISGAANFSGDSFFCTYEVVVGSQWTHVEGGTKGTTHVMENSHDGIAWSHPIDIHYWLRSVQGWPKLALQVWSVDAYGRKDLAGYGTCFIPLPSPAEHTLEVATWRPSYWHPSGIVRLYQQLRQMVMGGNPVLKDDSLIHSNESRFRLHTISGGIVTVKLNVMSRNTAALGLRFND